MSTWQAYPSGSTTGITTLADNYIDGFESVGKPSDPTATAMNSTNSMFSLLKGCCAGLGVPVGVGAGVVNTTPKVYQDPEQALGETTDGPATNTGRFSAIALMKGILVRVGL